MLKLNWGGDSFITETVVGAASYLAGKASSISGISTDDRTGRVTIKLISPYGAFENVLAFPAAAPVPAGTPMKVLTNPPPGVGPYVIEDVVPNVSFKMVQDPGFAAFHIPGIPLGHLRTIQVTIVSNTTTEAEQVLDNQVDNFDAFDTVPSALLSEISSQASNRFAYEPSETTEYFFLNQSKAPFNNKLAREAVNYAVDRDAFVRLAGGSMAPGCYLLPPGIIGHPTAPCPYGSANSVDLAKGQALLKQAHLVGAPVTVWGESGSPVQQWVEYYAGVLNQLGFKATIKFVTGSTYFPTIGSKSADPQTGWSYWEQDFPNPIDFYLLVNAASIQTVGNRNRSYVDDPHIQAELAKLSVATTSDLPSVAAQWTALDRYVASQADELVFGYPEVVKFMSTAVDFRTAVYSDIYGNDWSTWELNR
jgi:peptide/nickel transport system substrate-binding protein